MIHGILSRLVAARSYISRFGDVLLGTEVFRDVMLCRVVTCYRHSKGSNTFLETVRQCENNPGGLFDRKDVHKNNAKHRRKVSSRQEVTPH